MTEEVIVTGGAGFIGANVVNCLVNKGFDVHVFDNLSTGNIKNLPLDKVKFYNIDLSKTKEYISKKEALIDLEETLKNAATSCMVSDVPVGCFLSGGIDSSLLTAILSNNSVNKINTFTIGFENENYDESGDAKKIANFLGTYHEEITLMPSEALALIPNLPKIYSEPFADPSQIPTALISREIKNKGIDVALTGDGGDEMFGGYVRHFQGSRIWSKLKLIPYPLRLKIGSILENLLKSKPDNIYLLDKINNFSEKVYKIAG